MISIKYATCAKKSMTSINFDVDSMFGKFSVPASLGTLRMLFVKINVKFFGKALSVPVLKITSRDSANSASLVTKVDRSSGEILLQTMTFSKTAVSNKNYIVNAIAHECIHQYLSVKASEYNSAAMRKKHHSENIGHKQAFLDKMNELNAKGFSITTEHVLNADDDDLMFDNDIYALVVAVPNSNNQCILIGSRVPMDVQKVRSYLLSKLKRLEQTDFSYTYLTTRSETGMGAMRATKTGLPPANARVYTVNKETVGNLLEHNTTKVIKRGVIKPNDVASDK